MFHDINGSPGKRFKPMFLWVASFAAVGTTALLLVKAAPPNIPVDLRKEWVVEWSDEFDLSTLDGNKWTTHEPWYPAGDSDLLGADAYEPADPVAAGLITFPIIDGAKVLSINARNFNTGEANPRNKQLMSAHLSSRSKYENFTNGYIEARVKNPGSDWLWPAFWLLGNGTGSTGDPWPGTGEIDIFEYINDPGSSTHPKQSPFFTMIWGCAVQNDYCKRTKDNPYPSAISHTNWNTYGLLRKDNQMIIYINDQEQFRYDLGDTNTTSTAGSGYGIPAPAKLFTTPMHIRFDLSAGRWSESVGSAAKPGSMYIDYVRVYKERATDPLPTSSKADFNSDGKVDMNDLFILLGNFNKTVPIRTKGDCNGDAKVDIDDLFILLALFGK
jgi:beta-glucanase (GH16 family)